MKVISKLANIDFQFGEVARDGNLLRIESAQDAKMQSQVFVSPQDIMEFLKRFLTSPSAIWFALALPYFYYRWRRSAKEIAKSKTHQKEWPKV